MQRLAENGGINLSKDSNEIYEYNNSIRSKLVVTSKYLKMLAQKDLSQQQGIINDVVVKILSYSKIPSEYITGILLTELAPHISSQHSGFAALIRRCFSKQKTDSIDYYRQKTLELWLAVNDKIPANEMIDFVPLILDLFKDYSNKAIVEKAQITSTHAKLLLDNYDKFYQHEKSEILLNLCFNSLTIDKILEWCTTFKSNKKLSHTTITYYTETIIRGKLESASGADIITLLQQKITTSTDNYIGKQLISILLSIGMKKQPNESINLLIDSLDNNEQLTNNILSDFLDYLGDTKHIETKKIMNLQNALIKKCLDKEWQSIQSDNDKIENFLDDNLTLQVLLYLTKILTKRGQNNHQMYEFVCTLLQSTSTEIQIYGMALLTNKVIAEDKKLYLQLVDIYRNTAPGINKLIILNKINKLTFNHNFLTPAEKIAWITDIFSENCNDSKIQVLKDCETIYNELSDNNRVTFINCINNFIQNKDAKTLPQLSDITALMPTISRYLAAIDVQNIHDILLKYADFPIICALIKQHIYINDDSKYSTTIELWLTIYTKKLANITNINSQSHDNGINKSEGSKSDNGSSSDSNNTSSSDIGLCFFEDEDSDSDLTTDSSCSISDEEYLCNTSKTAIDIQKNFTLVLEYINFAKLNSDTRERIFNYIIELTDKHLQLANQINASRAETSKIILKKCLSAIRKYITDLNFDQLADLEERLPQIISTKTTKSYENVTYNFCTQIYKIISHMLQLGSITKHAEFCARIFDLLTKIDTTVEYDKYNICVNLLEKLYLSMGIEILYAEYIKICNLSYKEIEAEKRGNGHSKDEYKIIGNILAQNCNKLNTKERWQLCKTMLFNVIACYRENYLFEEQFDNLLKLTNALNLNQALDIISIICYGASFEIEEEPIIDEELRLNTIYLSAEEDGLSCREKRNYCHVKHEYVKNKVKYDENISNTSELGSFLSDFQFRSKIIACTDYQNSFDSKIINDSLWPYINQLITNTARNIIEPNNSNYNYNKLMEQLHFAFNDETVIFYIRNKLNDFLADNWCYKNTADFFNKKTNLCFQFPNEKVKAAKLHGCEKSMTGLKLRASA